MEVVTRRILAMYGITYNDVHAQMVSFGEGAQLMIDNHIDAILYGAMVLPTPGLVNVNSQRQIRLLSLSDEVIQKLLKTYKGLETYTIPGNTYKGVDYPVKVIASQCNLIATGRYAGGGGVLDHKVDCRDPREIPDDGAADGHGEGGGHAQGCGGFLSTRGRSGTSRSGDG